MPTLTRETSKTDSELTGFAMRAAPASGQHLHCSNKRELHLVKHSAAVDERDRLVGQEEEHRRKPARCVLARTVSSGS